MAGYKVLVIKRVKGVKQGVRGHYDGETRHSTSEAREGWKPWVNFLDTGSLHASWQERGLNVAHLERPSGPEVGQALIKQKFAEMKHRRGRKPDKVRLDFVFGGPPPFLELDGTKGWDRDTIQAWVIATLNWLFAGLPDSILEHCVLHLDERSPHLQVTLVMYNAEVDRLGWSHVRHQLSRVPLPSKGVAHDSRIMQAIHAHYHDEVTSKFGLEAHRVGEAQLPREAAIDRNQGELLRAAADDYTPAYYEKLARRVESRLTEFIEAPPESRKYYEQRWLEDRSRHERVTWARNAGPMLWERANVLRELYPDLQFDLEVDLLELYRERWQGRDVAIRARVPGTVSLRKAAGDHQLQLRSENLEEREMEISFKAQELDETAHDLEERSAHIDWYEEFGPHHLERSTEIVEHFEGMADVVRDRPAALEKVRHMSEAFLQLLPPLDWYRQLRERLARLIHSTTYRESDQGSRRDGGRQF